MGQVAVIHGMTFHLCVLSLVDEDSDHFQFGAIMKIPTMNNLLHAVHISVG